MVLSSAIVCDRLDLDRRIADVRRTFCDLRFAIRISKTALTNFSLLLLKRHSGKQFKYHIAGGLLSVVLANCLYPNEIKFKFISSVLSQSHEEQLKVEIMPNKIEV